MTIHFSEDIIERVRESTDIVDLISDYVLLKRTGKNLKGLCPFHQEKTPSFIVNPDKQIFHCFGCGTGGNVFKFLMEYEKISFIEAVKFLANRANIPLPSVKKDKEQIKQEEVYDELYQANQFAVEYYHQNLLSSKGKKGLDYLLDRGLTMETIEKFQLGYSLDEWDALMKSAKKHNISEETLLKVGLLSQSDDGSRTFDKFRGRVMFPIHNIGGRVLAFGGRIVEESPSNNSLGKGEAILRPNSPKYLNTPETPIYHKGKILYGFYQAKDEIRKAGKVIIVEGYIDLISLVQAGIKNVSAPLGTAFTIEQAKLLSRYTKDVLISFDPDSAGQKATLRGLDLLLSAGLNVKIISLPQGKDPDLFVRENGKEGFEKLIKSAKDFITFKLQALESIYDFSSTADKRKIIDSMMESISLVPDEIKRADYIHQLAEKISVREELLTKELNKLLKSDEKKKGTEETTVVLSRPKKSADERERRLLRMMIEDASISNLADESEVCKSFTNNIYQQIAKKIIDIYKESPHSDAVNIITSIAEPEIQPVISELIIMDEKIEDKKRLAKEYIAMILERKIKLEIDEIKGQIRDADKSKDNERIALLSKKIDSLKKKQAKLAEQFKDA